MKVVHIVGGDLKKGANRGAYWLHKGLRAVGVDSSLIGPIPLSQTEDGVESLLDKKLEHRALDYLMSKGDSALVRLYRRRRRNIFSSGVFGRSLDRHPLVQSADLINLHWIAKGPIRLPAVRNTGKPIVWTMRDMWPFTGGCHYSLDCKRYEVGCGRCPALGSGSLHDLSWLLSRQKRRWVGSNVTFVGISDWISECARNSFSLRGCDIRTIYNCVDSDLFYPIKKTAAREWLGVRTEKTIVLAGAGRLADFYKGFDLFVKAVNKLDLSRILVLLFGDASAADLGGIGCETRALGYIDDEEQLRLAYSAADVFVAPSVQEAFGKTLVEAMCCATPVVCFDATGPAAIVPHHTAGYKATPFSPDDMANGIRWVVDHKNPDELRKAARSHARSTFDSKVIARRYRALYEEILGTDPR